MDPLTLDEIVSFVDDLFKTAPIYLGAAAATAVVGGTVYHVAERINRRRYLADKYMEQYLEGHLKVKPNIFNIRRIVSNNPEYKDKYWVRRNNEGTNGQRTGL